MKTHVYNPSPIETEIANALINAQREIGKHLKNLTITQASADLSQDNPTVKFNLADEDGDRHQIVLKIVQIPDQV